MQPPDAEPPPPPAWPPSETPGLDKAIARMNAPTPGFHLTPGLGGFSQPPMWSLPPPPQLLPMPPLPVPMGGGLAAFGATLPPPPPSPLILASNGPAAPTMPRPDVGPGIPETLKQMGRRLAPYATEMGAAIGRTLPSVGAAGAGALAAAPILLMPSNTGSTTIDLGDGLRTNLPPGQRYVPIERRVAPGVFGSDVGAIWKQVPGLYGEVDPGRGVLVDPDRLREALGDEAANRILNTPGIMPMAKRPTDEQLPSLPGNNSIGTPPEPDNDQEPPKEPPHVDLTNPVSKEKSNSEAPNASTGSTPGSQGSGSEDNKWGDPVTLQDHFERHGSDFGSTSADDYARQAQNFLRRAQRERLPTKIDSNGVTRIYDPINNIFGSYNADGTTRTFFKPNPARHPYSSNMDYWNAQPGLSQGSR